MGLFGAILGDGNVESESERDDPSENRYAILLNAGPDEASVAANAFNYAVELDDAGYEVRLYLDGQATKWPAEFADDRDRPFSYDWDRVRERGLLAGACGYCANAFDATEACDRFGVPLLSDAGEHAPAVAALADEGYELLTLG